MTTELKPLISPLAWIDHNRERYRIVVELPGVRKEDIELEIADNSFCIRGKREDADLVGCFFLAHPVNPDGADAALDAKGNLIILIPFRSPLKGKVIPIRQGTGEAVVEGGRQIEIEEGPNTLGTGTQ